MMSCLVNMAGSITTAIGSSERVLSGMGVAKKFNCGNPASCFFDFFDPPAIASAIPSHHSTNSVGLARRILQTRLPAVATPVVLPSEYRTNA